MKILFGMRDDGDMTEPMNIMLLSALAKKHFGAEVGLWVMERDDLRSTVKDFMPDIIAFSGITGSHKYYLEAGEAIKSIDKNFRIIVGGPHFTFFPGVILRYDSIDALCVGEGDDAWVEWLGAVINNGNPDEIPNIITRNNMNRVLVPSQNPLVKIMNSSSQLQNVGMSDYVMNPRFMRGRKINLDDLPFMDRGLIYNNTEFLYRYKRTIIASRGCPFRCTYCFEHQWNDMYQGVENAGAVRRLYSVDRLLSELEEVKKRYDTRFIKFYDDVFPPFPGQKEREWHEEFCDKYPKRIGLPFHVLTRCDLVVRLVKDFGLDILRDLKRAGMASLTMSIESGNQFIRDHIIMRDMTKGDIERSFKHARELGLHTFPNTILGIPAPILPRIEDTDFDEKIDKIGRQCQILREINGRKIDLTAVQKIAFDWFSDHHDRCRFILDFLKSIGLRESHQDYDKESVRFTLAQKPAFPEFPILAPYPKTKATGWTIAIDAFDGDFEKLHASYQEVSYLNCYSERYKKVMHNLELLGSFLALFAGSRNRFMQLINPLAQRLCIDYLTEITYPRAVSFYGWLYTISKTYMHYTRIYPMRYSFGEKWRFFKQMSGLDFWKQFKKRSGVKSLSRLKRPGQPLGGAPSISIINLNPRCGVFNLY